MLTNREFSALVDSGNFPDQVAVPLDEPFVNENGVIQNLLLERFSSAAIITSVPGSLRANHYHKTDWHYAYVVSGVVEYYFRKVGATEPPTMRRFEAGTMFFTPPMLEHAMFFPEQTKFITFAKNIRDTEHHEEDVVRVKLTEVQRNASGGWQIVFPTSS